VEVTTAMIKVGNPIPSAVQVGAGHHVVKFEFEPLIGALAELSSPSRP
jgi:hypothetical protein